MFLPAYLLFIPLVKYSAISTLLHTTQGYNCVFLHVDVERDHMQQYSEFPQFIAVCPTPFIPHLLLFLSHQAIILMRQCEEAPSGQES